MTLYIAEAAGTPKEQPLAERGLMPVEHSLVSLSPELKGKISSLLDSGFVDLLKDQVYDKDFGYDYSPLSNIAMIYLYIHQKKSAFEDRKDKTKQEYLSELLRFYREVERTVGDIRNLDRRMMENYEMSIIARYPKRTTASWKLVVVKSFLKWLYKVGYINQDITIDMSGATVKIKDRPDRNLKTDEVQRMIRYHHNNPKALALIALLATTGLRIAEVASAVWGNLEWDEEAKGYFLTVKGKGNKIRDAYIQENVLDVIKEYRRRVGMSDQINPADKSPFYPNVRGEHYNPRALSEQLNKYLQQAGVRTDERKITAHWFRHYFARQADLAGASLTDIQRTLGHESVITTQGYLERSAMRRQNVGRLVKIEL